MVILVTSNLQLLDDYEIPRSFAGKLLTVTIVPLLDGEECYEDIKTGILIPNDAANEPRPRSGPAGESNNIILTNPSDDV